MARWLQLIPQIADNGFREARIGLSQRNPLESEGRFQIGEINPPARGVVQQSTSPHRSARSAGHVWTELRTPYHLPFELRDGIR